MSSNEEYILSVKGKKYSLKTKTLIHKKIKDKGRVSN